MAATLAACGGGGKEVPDAGTGQLMGLGQLCAYERNGDDCPANASGCLKFSDSATMGICAPLCVTGGTLMTGANAQITAVTPDPTDAAQVTICTSAFTGTVGVPRCSAVVVDENDMQLQPPLVNGQPEPNTTYTGVRIACTIGCGTDGSCPNDLRCNTTLQRCEP